jgi:uncharacterized membrane protein YagU involved in acid resistance
MRFRLYGFVKARHSDDVQWLCQKATSYSNLPAHSSVLILSDDMPWCKTVHWEFQIVFCLGFELVSQLGGRPVGN